MYEIKFIHKNETTENTLYTPGSNIYCLLSARLNLECGKAGELTLEVPDANPAKADFVCLTDEILVYRDGEELWRGRAITREEDFYKTGTLTCEGVLAYLYDTYYPPFEFSGSPTDFLSAVLDNHNAQVEERKRIYLGNVTVEDNNDYIARSSIEYNRTLTVLTDKLINDSLGGYFRVRIEGGVKYLDYLDTYGTTATQPVEFGVNLLDIAQGVEYSDLATVILPLGAKLEDSDGNETDEYLTIADVNGGSIYYADEAAVEEYGWIVVCNIWEDVTEASNLLTKAKNYLAQVTSAVSSFEVNAVDLALISSGYAPINLGDMVLIRSKPHGVNQYVELTALDIDLLDPSNDTLTFGADTASLTDSQRSSDRSVQAALDSLSVRYTNLVASTITTDYLSANYATITNLDAVTATIANLSSVYATIENLDAVTASIASLSSVYATIENLDAATANISNLSTEIANINSLLSGNIGAGTVQTIHLSADNTVIDEALIETIYAANGIISDLVAGTIYTDNVQIANNAGQNLWIDGATIQINDGTNVRVQIGEDASGDYNLYLWNANGVLIWDALGLTEAGLTGNGAIIKDAAVADDAAIKGTKLDIASVAERLNEDGSLVVDAANVTINDTTLAAAYVTIIDNTDAAQTAAETANAAAVEAQSVADAAQAAADEAQSVADAAQAAVDAVSVGARNLILKSEEISTTRTNATNNWLAEINPFAYNSDYGAARIQEGGDFTLSFDYVISGITTACSVYLALRNAEAGYTRGNAASLALAVGDNSGHYSCTFTPTAEQMEYGTRWLLTGFGAGNNAGAEISLTHIKLETGNTETDWSPAPEDLQAAADEAQAAADAAQSAADAAQAAADEAAALAASVETRTTTLETELEVVQGQITAKVWQTDITEAISGIVIGSRNYLTGTRDFDSGTWAKSSNVTLDKDNEGYTEATWAATSTLGWNAINTTNAPIQFSLVRGQPVVLSFEVRSDDYEALNALTNQGLAVTFNLCGPDNTTRTLYRLCSLYTTALTNDWQRITVAATLTDDYFTSGSGDIDDDTRFYVAIFDYSLYSMQVRKVKLEIGTVATDWTPAPEDEEAAISTIQDQYATVVQTIEGITTEIGDITTVVSNNYTELSSKITTVEATAEGITAEISDLTTTVNDNYSTLSSRITTVEATADGITASVSSVQSQLDNLSIGSRNYLPNTRTMDGWAKSSNVALGEDDEGYTVATWAATSTVGWNAVQSRDPIQFSLVRGQTVTLSFDIRSDDFDSSDTSDTNRVVVGFCLCAADSTTRTLYQTTTVTRSSITADWVRYKLTVTLTDDYFALGSGTIDDDTRLFIVIYDYSPYSMQVRKAKLEIGTVATDWTPAPEDTETVITTIQDQYATVVQTIEGITTEIGDITTVVSNNYTELSSKITTVEATAEGITAEISDLTTTVNDNYSTLSSRITTVEATADGITASVSSVQSQLDNLSIGGRNLILASEEITATRTDTTNNYLSEIMPFMTNSDYGVAKLQEGGKFTLSFDYEITGVTTAVSLNLALRNSASGFSTGNVINTLPLSVGSNSGHYSCTFTPTSEQMEYGTSWILSNFGAGSNKGTVVTLRHVKFEAGNTETDWTPAPEDDESDIATLSDKYSNLALTVDGITTEVGSLTTTTDTLTSNVTTLTATANSLTASVSSVQTQLDGLSIGGRNYIIQSTMTAGYRLNNAGNSYASTYSSITAYTAVPTSASEMVFSVHTVYTNEGDCYFQVAFYDSSKTFLSRALQQTANTTEAKTSWTVEVPTGAVYFRAALPTSIKDKVKFEAGNVATDWSPAPEDTEEQISEVTAKLALTIETDADGNSYGCISANADYIQFDAGQLVVNSDNFTLTGSGIITANEGTIGPLTITNSEDRDASTGHLYAKSAMLQKHGITVDAIDPETGEIVEGAAEIDTEWGMRYPYDDSTNTVTYLAWKDTDDDWTQANRVLAYSITAAGRLMCSGLSLYPNVPINYSEDTGITKIGTSKRCAYTDDTALVLNVIKFSSRAVYSDFDPSVSNTYDIGGNSYYWRGIYCNTIYRTNTDSLSSDRRLKQNILELSDDYTALIMGLTPVEFDYINGDSHRKHMGFIAQDVRDAALATVGDLSLFRATVNGDDDTAYSPEIPEEQLTWAIAPEELIAPLVKVVQDHEREIADLKAKLAALTA